MKTFVFPKTTRIQSWRCFGNPLMVNGNNSFDFEVLDNNIPVNIDGLYIAPEDVEVRYSYNGSTKVLKADKGDLIIVFGKGDYIKNPIVVVKNKQWKENMVSFLAKEAERKATDEVHAKYASDIPCCGKCPSC